MKVTSSRKVITLRVPRDIAYENSFGRIAEYSAVPMEYKVYLGRNASFEMYSSDCTEEEHYAEGELVLGGCCLEDYDGVFSLCPSILYMLRREGVDVSEMQETLEIEEDEIQKVHRELTFYQVDYEKQ